MTVYPPREDSKLVEKYLEEEELEGKKALDMGTGSGILTIKMAEKGADVVAADINPEALEEARSNAEKKGVESSIEFVETDLFENIEGEFDLIVFNPPYLPGEEEEVGDEEIWSGGKKGIEVTEQFLEDSVDFLREDGKVVLVLSSGSEYEEILNKFDLKIVAEKKLWFETLYLVEST